jgi:hypothetical protein
VVEKYGDAIPAHPVGTGPFRLAQWRALLAHRAGAQPALPRGALRRRARGRRRARARRCWRSFEGPPAAHDRPRGDLHHRGVAAALAGLPEPRASTCSNVPASSSSRPCPNGRVAPNLRQGAASRATAR